MTNAMCVHFIRKKMEMRRVTDMPVLHMAKEDDGKIVFYDEFYFPIMVLDHDKAIEFADKIMEMVGSV